MCSLWSRDKLGLLKFFKNVTFYVTFHFWTTVNRTWPVLSSLTVEIRIWPFKPSPVVNKLIYDQKIGPRPLSSTRSRVEPTFSHRLEIFDYVLNCKILSGYMNLWYTSPYDDKWSGKYGHLALQIRFLLNIVLILCKSGLCHCDDRQRCLSQIFTMWSSPKIQYLPRKWIEPFLTNYQPLRLLITSTRINHPLQS